MLETKQNKAKKKPKIIPHTLKPSNENRTAARPIGIRQNILFIMDRETSRTATTITTNISYNLTRARKYAQKNGEYIALSLRSTAVIEI